MPTPDPTYKPWLTFPLLSPRELPLIISYKIYPLMVPLLTVELYVKWYKLYLIEQTFHDEVSISEIDFPGDEYCAADESPYSDHVPNPRVVGRFAARNGYRVDEVALETIIGRWEREHLNNYSGLDEEPCASCGRMGSACKCSPGGLY